MNEPRFELMESVEQRTQIFEIMKAQDLLKINMHAWSDPSLENWLDFTENGFCDLWHAEGWGIYYLTQGLGVTPWAHFAVWKEARKEAQKFLCAAVTHGFSTYAFPAVLGLTPACFRHVPPLLRACGFEVLGRLPGTTTMRGKPEDGILSIYRRR